MKSNGKRLIIFLIIIAAIIAFRFSPLTHYLSLESIKLHREYLLNFVSNYYNFSVVSYVIAYALATALSLPGATILTLLGGFLFGVFPGVIVVNIGATLGAIGAFTVARYIMRNMVQAKYGEQLVTLR